MEAEIGRGTGAKKDREKDRAGAGKRPGEISDEIRDILLNLFVGSARPHRSRLIIGYYSF
jgi:hypothetical protein